MIGIYNPADGTVKAMYCHYDGYPAYNGKMLREYYSDPVTAEQLIDLGYASSLCPTVSETREAAVHQDQETVPYESVDQYMRNGHDYCGTEYLYLFDTERWFVASRYGDDQRFTDIDTILSEKAA